MFPTEENVVCFFAPAKWPAALANKDKSFLLPGMTISLLNEYYASETGKIVVKNAITGLYSIIEPRKPLEDRTLTLAAELFVSKYGHVLSMFALNYFFADYIMEYKSSYSQIEMQDILQKCGVFLRHWQEEYGRMSNRRKVSEPIPEKNGRMSLYCYLYDEYVRKNRRIETSSLYLYGFVTDEEVKGIESGQLLCL